MGLLTQALAGGIAAAADTGSQLVIENAKANRQNELEQARALREENLARMRNTWAEEAAVKAHARGEESKIAGEERTFARGESGQVTPEGVPLTRAQVQEASGANGPPPPGATGILSSAEYKRKTTIDKDIRGEDGELLTEAEVLARKEAGKPLSSSKEAAAEAKLAQQKELATLQLETKERLHKAEMEMRDRIADLRVARAQGDKSAEIALKKEELKLNALALGGKVMDGATKEGRELTDDERTIVDTAIAKAGVKLKDAPAISKEEARAQATKEAAGKAGWMSSDSADFPETGGDRNAWIENRTKEIMAGTAQPVTEKKQGKGIVSTANAAGKKPAAAGSRFVIKSVKQ